MHISHQTKTTVPLSGAFEMGDRRSGGFGGGRGGGTRPLFPNVNGAVKSSVSFNISNSCLPAISISIGAALFSLIGRRQWAALSACP